MARPSGSASQGNWAWFSSFPVFLFIFLLISYWHLFVNGIDIFFQMYAELFGVCVYTCEDHLDFMMAVWEKMELFEKSLLLEIRCGDQLFGLSKNTPKNHQ